ncbi:MAG TPA: TrkA family potassium uptake protein [Candidatus Brocadiia bacterium]|nr:TrkA family potassium uptake protein [Candidatus Brocadiia bacterium]
MLRYAVIGLGNFGSYLATRLHENDCEVLAIDSSPDKAEAVKSFVDKTVILDATDRRALSAMSLETYDGVILSLGDRIEASVLCALHLRELGVRNIMAKAINDDHGRILSRLGVSEIIYPEKDMAIRLANQLSWKNVIEYIPLAPGYTIMEIALPKDLIGKTLRESQLRARFNVEVIAVKELVPPRVNLVPAPDTVLKDSDVLVVLGKDKDLEKIRREG